MVEKISFTGKTMKGDRDVPVSETPPYPRNLSLTLINVCNQRCITCWDDGKDKPQRMPKEQAFELMKQAYELGAREVGLYGGGVSEPFMYSDLEECIAFAKKTGYTYIYLTTNGSLVNEKRLRKAFENGLHSIRFSINAGKRETYKEFHGQDCFDQVIQNVRLADKLRRELNPDVILTVSFVDTLINKTEFSLLQNLLKDSVDSLYHIEAFNNGGLLYEKMAKRIVMPNVPEAFYYLHSKQASNDEFICPQPFNRFQINAYGFLDICCAVYRNYLSVADLNCVSLKEAWVCKAFKKIRHSMINKQISEDCQCYNCLNNKNNPIKPLVEFS